MNSRIQEVTQPPVSDLEQNFWVHRYNTPDSIPVMITRAELQTIVDSAATGVQVMNENQTSDWQKPECFGFVRVVPAAASSLETPAVPAAEPHVAERHATSPERSAADSTALPIELAPVVSPPITHSALTPPLPYPELPQSAATTAPLTVTPAVAVPASTAPTVPEPPSLRENPPPITLKSLTEGEKPNLKEILVSSAALISMPIIERPRILGSWLLEGDLGWLFAPRGHGKTWLMMLIAHAIATCEALGLWVKGERQRRVVYFDAEMNLPDVQQRAKLIGMSMSNLVWLQSDLIYEKLNRGLNIADKVDQSAIAGILNDGDVLIIDNLSTASCGMAENDNDDFDLIVNWLLSLRHRGITVIIVHHAGKNGKMRGASRREDMAHWVLSLKDDSGEGDITSWVTKFTKCRNCQAMDAPPLKWTIKIENESLKYTCVPHSGRDAMLALIKDGIETANEIAQEMSVTAGCVSKWANKLASENKIVIKNRKYQTI